MIPVVLASHLLALGLAQGAEPGPCAGLQVRAVDRRSAAPGEVVELEGAFGERLPIKVPSVNKGNSHPMEVVGWTPSLLSVRLPPGLLPGLHKIGVSCYYDGGHFSSGWLDLDVIEGKTTTAPPPPDIDVHPPQLQQDPRLLLGLGQAFWMRRRYHDCAEAYGQAAEAFNALGDLEREARARYGRSLALAALGRQEEGEEEQGRAAGLYWTAMHGASGDDLRRLELEYADVGYHVARIDQRRGLFAEAERVHGIRLDIFQRRGDVSGQATAWQGLAEVAAADKRPREAAERFDRAAELYRQAGNPHGVKACRAGALAERKASPRE